LEGRLKRLNQIAKGLKAFGRELGRATHGTPAQTPAAKARPKVGLALGGGFARGLAHIGVIKVFESEGIPIDYVAGTSIGACIGAAYCSGVSAKELEEVAALLKFSHFARFSLSRLGLWNNDRLSILLNKLLKVKTFEELKIPLAVTATDFVTGDPVVFSKGPLVDPVRASCAYPAMFLPVKIDGRLMIDGLLAHPVPSTPLKQMGADKVAAVYFSSHWVQNGGPKHFLEVIGQCFSIAQANVSTFWQANADVVIEPDVSQFSYDGFNRCSDLVRVGEEAARALVPKMREWFDGTEAQVVVKQDKAAPDLVPSTLPVAG
jgi:NTE family protein